MKITPTGVNEALKSLQSNRFYPLSEMSHYPNLSGGVVKGTGLQPAPTPPPRTPLTLPPSLSSAAVQQLTLPLSILALQI
jgi:hypothetical protein